MVLTAIVVHTFTGKLGLSMRYAAGVGRALASGFTLIEMVVALAIMGVAIALAGPALVSPKANVQELFFELLSDSRGTAVRRAEALDLDIAADGRWSLTRGVSRGAAVVRTGRMALSPGPARIRISPLGICQTSGSARMRVDPLTCAPSSEVR